MCLISRTDIPAIAEEDIQVVKGLRVADRKSSKYSNYVTPIQRARVPKDGVMIPKKKRIEIEFDSRFYRYIIEGGVIHSYSNILQITNEQLMFHATIPKGSKFFLSSDRTEYVSDKLIVHFDKPLYYVLNKKN